MDLLEVAKEVEPIPAQHSFICQHHYGSQARRQVEDHVHGCYCDDGDGCAALVGATCSRGTCGGWCVGASNCAKHGTCADDAGYSDREDRNEYRDDNQHGMQ